jgi:RNA polymerase sigma-70 factor (ECF subfamily)
MVCPAREAIDVMDGSHQQKNIRTRVTGQTALHPRHVQDGSPKPRPLHEEGSEMIREQDRKRDAGQGGHGKDTGLGELMERYLDGDQRAFTELFGRLAPLMRAQIRSKISDPATAEDLLQQTFMKAHGARERFATPEGSDPDRAVTVWYSAIARNATIDHLRKIYRDRAIKLDTAGDDTTELLDGVRDAAPGAEERALEQERQLGLAARVRAALAGLPKTQREVVTMHKLEGIPMAEIAKQLGVREGTLRVRAHRGYKTLAAALGGMRVAQAA